MTCLSRCSCSLKGTKAFMWACNWLFVSWASVGCKAAPFPRKKEVLKAARAVLPIVTADSMFGVCQSCAGFLRSGCRDWAPESNSRGEMDRNQTPPGPIFRIKLPRGNRFPAGNDGRMRESWLPAGSCNQTPAGKRLANQTPAGKPISRGEMSRRAPILYVWHLQTESVIAITRLVWSIRLV